MQRQRSPRKSQISPRKSQISPRKSQRSRVNPLRRKTTTAKKPQHFGNVMPRVTADKKRIKTRDINLVNNFVRSGGQITGMRPIEPADVDNLIRKILRDNGEIPLSHRHAYHRHSSTSKKPESFKFSSNK